MTGIEQRLSSKRSFGFLKSLMVGSLGVVKVKGTLLLVCIYQGNYTVLNEMVERFPLKTEQYLEEIYKAQTK